MKKSKQRMCKVSLERRLIKREEYCVRQFGDRFDDTDPTDEQAWLVQRMISHAIEYGRRQEALDHYVFQHMDEDEEETNESKN